MKTITKQLFKGIPIIVASAGLLAASINTFAIEGIKLSVQSSNVVLSWPSTNNGETYIIQYRPTLNLSDSWQTLADFFPPASNTNITFYTNLNAVQNFSIYGGGSSQNILSLAIAAPTVPMAIPTNGSGGAVPLALYPPGFDLSGFLILDPTTGESVSGARYSMSPLDWPSPLDGGSGNGMTNQAPETGFYRVVRDGVHIYGLTNGMTLSGSVSIPLEIALNNTNEIASVTFYGGDSPLIGSSAHTNAGGGWVLDWITPLISNGNHNIYAEVDFVTDDPVTNVPVTVTVSNVISFPNYFSRIFGDWMWLYAETIIPNAGYRIDIYGQNTNYLGHFSGTTDGNGRISFLWGLSGLTDTNFYGVFTVTNTLQNFQQNVFAGNGFNGSSPGFQDLSTNEEFAASGPAPNASGSSSSASQSWAKEAKWEYNNFKFVVAAGPLDNGYAANRQVMAMLGGESGEYGGVVHTLNPFNSNHNLSPGNADLSSVFSLSDAAAKTNLLSYFGDIQYRNCYFWGHGSPSAIGGVNPAGFINVYDLQKAMGNFLNTPKPQNFHPYRFVFIDGCSTGKGNFCETFGIPAQTVNNQFFANNGVESRAFLGFKSPKNFEPTKWTFYSIMIGRFYEDWMSGFSMQQCVTNAVNGVYTAEQLMMDSSWVIYGAADLQINTVARP